jgi:hypothetical protein
MLIDEMDGAASEKNDYRRLNGFRWKCFDHMHPDGIEDQ